MALILILKRNGAVARYSNVSSQSCNQREIASILHVTQPTVTKDLSHIRQEAQDNLQNHIHEVIPLEYQKCIAGMKSQPERDVGNSDHSFRPTG